MKKAQSREMIVVLVAILIFLVIIVIAFSSQGATLKEKINTIFPFLGFGNTTIQATEMLRYDIHDESIEYYDGNSFRSINTDIFQLNDKKLSQKELRQALGDDYYFNPDLHPEQTVVINQAVNIGGILYPDNAFPSAQIICIKIKNSDAPVSYGIIEDLRYIKITFGGELTGMFIDKEDSRNTNAIQYIIYNDKNNGNQIIGLILAVDRKIQIEDNLRNRVYIGSSIIQDLNGKSYNDFAEDKIYRPGILAQNGIQLQRHETLIELTKRENGICTNQLFGVFIHKPDGQTFFTPIDVVRFKTNGELALTPSATENLREISDIAYNEIQTRVAEWHDSVLAQPATINYQENKNSPLSEQFRVEKFDYRYLVINLNQPI